MGDTSPKNINKLKEKRHDEHVKKEDEKHENAERQHVPSHTHPTAEEAGHPEPEKTGA